MPRSEGERAGTAPSTTANLAPVTGPHTTESLAATEDTRVGNGRPEGMKTEDTGLSSTSSDDEAIATADVDEKKVEPSPMKPTKSHGSEMTESEPMSTKKKVIIVTALSASEDS